MIWLAMLLIVVPGTKPLYESVKIICRIHPHFIITREDFFKSNRQTRICKNNDNFVHALEYKTITAKRRVGPALRLWCIFDS